MKTVETKIIDWQEGQDVYEQWESSGKGYGNQVNAYRK
jgi:hypothetical protein